MKTRSFLILLAFSSLHHHHHHHTNRSIVCVNITRILPRRLVVVLLFQALSTSRKRNDDNITFISIVVSPRVRKIKKEREKRITLSLYQRCIDVELSFQGKFFFIFFFRLISFFDRSSLDDWSYASQVISIIHGGFCRKSWL